MLKRLKIYFHSSMNWLTAIAGLILFVGSFVTLKFLHPALYEWKNFDAIIGLLSAYGVSAILLMFLALQGTSKRFAISLPLSLVFGCILVAIPLIALWNNAVNNNGLCSDAVLFKCYYPMSALIIVTFIWCEITAFVRTRRAALKVIVFIILGVFVVSLHTEYNFVNYIHKDSYRELKSQEVTSAAFEDNTLTIVVSGKSGDVKCAITNCGVSGWRFQSEYDGELSDYGAGQLLSYYLDDGVYGCLKSSIAFTKDTSDCTLTAEDGTKAVITYSPFKATFYSVSGAISQEISAIGVVDGTTVVRGTLNKNEAVWGGGEHFDHVNQRGQHITINAIDDWGGIKGNSYMPIPILLSSRGSGLFMNRFERMEIDVDSYEVPNDVWQFAVPNAPCDLFVYATEAPADVLYGYSTITGFSDIPAEWNYGVVICRYYPDFSNLQGVIDMANEMEAHDFEWDAIILEGFDSGNPGLTDETYAGSLKEVVDYVHGLGKKCMIYMSSGTPYYLSYDMNAVRLVENAEDGSTWLPDAAINNPMDHPERGKMQYIDITDEDTLNSVYQTWYQAFVEIGVDGAKIDFCELFPDFIEVNFTDGKTSGAHHWYSTVYNSLQYQKMAENEGGTMALARGGGIGAQRYPFIWMGDQPREMKYVASTLKGVICSGISGVPFTTYDMAGYKNGLAKDEEEVFIRAVENTAFIGCIQTHGDVKRAYDYPEYVQDIYRTYTDIHEALRPYLVEQGTVSSSTGLPLVRHLALSYWHDENVWDIEDEYMLGSDILVAPIVKEGKTKRNIYLPEGNWKNLWTGEIIQGGVWLKKLYSTS